MGITLTDVLLFGKAQLADVDKATLVIYRRNILRWSALGGYLDIIVKGVAPLSLPDAIANSLSYVKAFGGTEQRDIPDNYLQRQFIYMLDGSYLLTDIVPTYDGRIEMDFQTTSVQSGATSYLGGRSESYPAGLRLGTGSSNSRFLVSAFSDSAYTSTTSAENNTRYKFTFNNKVATLESGGSTLFTNTFTGENANGDALVINGLNNAGTITANLEGIYLYSFKAWNAQGELIADYVPAVQKGTVPVVGFYDTVSGTFKTATAGTFAAGGEAVPTPDAPMDIVSNNGVLKYGVLSKNLFDKSDIITGKILNDTGAEVTQSAGYYSGHISVDASTEYTISQTGGEEIYLRVLEYDSTDTMVKLNKGNQTGTQTKTFTTGATTTYVIVSGSTKSNALDTLQLERGSTATEYEPYREGVYADGTVETVAFNLIEETHERWSVNSSGVVITTGGVWGHIVKVEPNKTYYYKQIEANVVIGFFTSKPEVGSVTYNQARTITNLGYFTTPNDNSIKYALLRAGPDSYVYDQSATAEMLLKVGDYQDVQSIIDGVVTRNVGIKVLDGTENGWMSVAAVPGYYYLRPASTALADINVNANAGLSSHFVFSDLHSSQIPVGAYTTGSEAGYNRIMFKLDSGTYPTIDSFKQYLSDQYAAGTPVIIVYPLKTPTTESVAGQTLQVTDGDNVLEITQASLNNLELEAKYQAAVSLTIQEVQDANLDPNVQVTIN